MRSLAVDALSIRDFRNLASVDLELGPRFNVLSGDNGQGKTNLVEAAYVMATSKSFRTSKLTDLVAVGKETASVRGRLREDDDPREQSVGIGKGLRAARIDGKRPPTLAAYATRTPAVVFHPGAIALSAGSGGERRRLLDRIALFLSPMSLEDAEAYAKALRSRQKSLDTRGESARDLDDWEELVVRHGTALSDARERAASELIPAAREAFTRLGASGTGLDARYVRSAPPESSAYRAQLAARRTRDRQRGSATIGPHRDELTFELGGRPVRGMASQGQHRTIVLALRLAEIDVLAESRGVRPLMLLDDVSSELDRDRTAALFAALRREASQVLLTTTRPELIDTGALSVAGDRRDFRVVGGQVSPL
jgi:DNA replication and repair protein RecF